MQNNYLNIPEELKIRNQWCCWKLEDIGATKYSKIPYDAKTGRLASVIDSTTWSSFETCLQVVKDYSGVGFIFGENDPYTFIDLDSTDGDKAAYERQLKIFKEFDSYSEISPSGKGLHIIIKGHVPQGRRRSFVEIYSSQRYATMTGNVYNDKGIIYRQELLTQLWEQMSVGGPATLTYTGDAQEINKDADILRMARDAVNGDKFEKLLKGDWQDLYPSQSEADLALINILAFYTQNRNQITRIFRQSVLGSRVKAKRDNYVNWAIDKSFDRMLPSIDLDGFKISIEDFQNDVRISPDSGNSLSNINDSRRNLAGSSNSKTTPFEGVNKGAAPLPASSFKLLPPPGLVGEIAQWIYEAAPRPFPEAAIAGAIGLMAGICGKAYNISGTGLNQFILLLAKTGRGKEAMASGIDRLMESIRFMVPTSHRFIGPAEISSGQALVKYINKNPCFVSILGEFAHRMAEMANPQNRAEYSLKRMILDLYNKSGHTRTFRDKIYSDKDKDIPSTKAPAFSILAESVPEKFYETLNEDLISDGFLPRFLLLEYDGIRVPENENHMAAYPNQRLTERFAALVGMCEHIMHAQKVININLDDKATIVFKAWNKHCDAQINGNKNQVITELWNRGDMNARKLAGLIAVGVNMVEPLVTEDVAQWAINMVASNIRTLSGKFEAGEIGANTSEIKQVEEVKKAIREYFGPEFDFKKYKVEEKLFNDKIIPYQFIHRRLGAMAAFRTDKMGPTISLKRAIQNLMESDTIREIGKIELAAKYGTTQRSFVLKDLRVLE